MSETRDVTENEVAQAVCPCAGDGDGQHNPALDQECAWALDLARAVLAAFHVTRRTE